MQRFFGMAGVNMSAAATTRLVTFASRRFASGISKTPDSKARSPPSTLSETFGPGPASASFTLVESTNNSETDVTPTSAPYFSEASVVKYSTAPTSVISSAGIVPDSEQSVRPDATSREQMAIGDRRAIEPMATATMPTKNATKASSTGRSQYSTTEAHEHATHYAHRPAGTEAERNVAADRSKIDPLDEHRAHKSGHTAAGDHSAMDQSSADRVPRGKKATKAAAEGRPPRSKSEAHTQEMDYAHRPAGSEAEANVAADRSKIDPLDEYRALKSKEMAAGNHSAMDQSSTGKMPTSKKPTKAAAEGRHPRSKSEDHAQAIDSTHTPGGTELHEVEGNVAGDRSPTEDIEQAPKPHPNPSPNHTHNARKSKDKRPAL